MQTLRDPGRLAELIEANAPPGLVDSTFDASDWIADPANFALVQDDDLGMFEAGPDWPGPLHAHVIFASRGNQALETARAMLRIAFGFGATEILGETPVHLPHALAFARRLGFVPYGEAQRKQGRVVLSRLNGNPFSRQSVA